MKLYNRCVDYNYKNLSHYFTCVIPSRDISINDSQYSSFSQPKIEKSNSKVVMFAKMEANPLQNWIRILNCPTFLERCASITFIK